MPCVNYISRMAMQGSTYHKRLVFSHDVPAIGTTGPSRDICLNLLSLLNETLHLTSLCVYMEVVFGMRINTQRESIVKNVRFNTTAKP